MNKEVDIFKDIDFKRYTNRANPADNITWKTFHCTLQKADGTVLYDNAHVEAPHSWSQQAVDTLAFKYFRKNGVPVDELSNEKFPDEKIPLQFLHCKPLHEDKRERFLGAETSAKQVFHRMAGAWTYWGLKYHYFDTQQAWKFYSACYTLLAHQVFAPNSPQWFNTGLAWAYGITGKAQGHWHHENNIYYSPGNDDGDDTDPRLKVVPSKDEYTRPQCHACYIQKIEDNLVRTDGIFDLVNKEARLFKQGSGSGGNYSRIRAKGEPLAGGGASSGLMSFLKLPDVAAGTIKSGGVTRRAARMVVVDIDHPEIEDFIDWKVKEENKVAALEAGSFVVRRALRKIFDLTKNRDNNSEGMRLMLLDGALFEANAAGVPFSLAQRTRVAAQQGMSFEDFLFEEFNTAWEGEAYQTVSGQNANNSVRIPDEFMKRLTHLLDYPETELDQSWQLKDRTTDKVYTVNPVDLWNKICKAAWLSGDPGVQFSDVVNEWNTCADEEIRGCNPCAEYLWYDDTACNLASLNLCKFLSYEHYEHDKHGNVVATSKWHNDSYKTAVRIVTTILDITVSMAQYPTKSIAEQSLRYRTLGIGYANLGAAIMRQGFPYDSDEGRKFASKVTSDMTAIAYQQSALLAARLGSYPAYETAAHCKVMDQHHQAHVHALKNTDLSTWGDIPTQRGLRNAQVSLIAPTGTIALVMGCDTTGCEPDFSLVKYKKLAGGGSMKIVNHSVKDTLTLLGYGEANRQHVLDEILAERPFRHLLKPEHHAIFDCAVPSPGGTRSIDPMGHVKMLAAIQPFVSGGISKTVNLPHNATVQNISDIYTYAWRNGIKNIAVYRDGSKLSQPLNVSAAQMNQKREGPNPVTKDYVDARKEVSSFQKDVQETEDEDKEFSASVDAILSEKQDVSDYPGDITPENAHLLSEDAPRQRKRLPARRNGYTQKLVVGNMSFYIRTGEYEDGTLGELFITASKSGTLLRALMDAFAVSMSIALQYGVPLDEFIEAFRDTQFEPNGIVAGHSDVRMCSSILDAIVRDLEKHYLQKNTEKRRVFSRRPDDTLIEYTGEDAQRVYPSIKEVLAANVVEAPSKNISYQGIPCTHCEQFKLIRNGNCYLCANCGETTGCS